MASPTMEKLKGGKGKSAKGKSKTAKEAKLENTETEVEDEEGQPLTEVPDFAKMKKKAIDEFYEGNDYEIEEFDEMTLAEKRSELYGVYNEVVLGVADCYEEYVAEEEPEVKSAKGKKGKGKGKAKGTAVAKTEKALEGEVIPPDEISRTAQELETVGDENSAHNILDELVESDGLNYFKMGGILSVIQDNAWFGDHENFRKYIEEEVHGMEYRKATYLTKLYKDIVDSGCTWDEVSSIGWSSLRVIAPILTKKNVKKWVKKAEAMTTLQLIQEVKTDQKKTAPKADGEAVRVSTKTFKCHDDQKETINTALELAMEQGETEVETVALEYICTQFVAGGGAVPAKGKKGKGKAAKPISIVQHFKNVLDENDGDIDGAVDDIMGAFEKVFPDVDVMVNAEEEPEEEGE